MSLPKIRLEDAEQIEPGLWRPDDATLRHLTKSLRLYEGAAVEGLLSSAGKANKADKEGKKFFMKLVRRNGEYLLRATDEAFEEPERIEITLVLGLLKQDQFDGLLRVSAELGLNNIVPLVCERSVPRFTPAELPKKMSRWNKILAEATKVSGSIHPPALLEPIPFAALDWHSLPAQRYAAILSDDAVPISTIPSRDGQIVIAVGPEGDWSDAERDILLQNSFIPISLGPRILRASTAATAAIAYIRMM